MNNPTEKNTLQERINSIFVDESEEFEIDIDAIDAYIDSEMIDDDDFEEDFRSWGL